MDHLLLLRTLKGSFVAADLVPPDVPLDGDAMQPGTPVHLVVSSGSCSCRQCMLCQLQSKRQGSLRKEQQYVWPRARYAVDC